MPKSKNGRVHCRNSGMEKLTLNLIQTSDGFKFNLYHAQGKFRKQGLTFHTNCLLGTLHEMSNPVFWKKSEKYFKMPSVDCFFDWTTCMCNYYFCKHLKKYCRGESYNHTSFFRRELDRVPDKLSVSSQSDDRNPHTTCCTHILESCKPR